MPTPNDEGNHSINTALTMTRYRQFKAAAVANDASLSEPASMAIAEWVNKQAQMQEAAK